jgi:chemotaxis protein histidine kinase CheA
MSVDPFAERLAKVRQRFVSSLQGKIDDAYGAVSLLMAVSPAASASVAAAYRSMHGIVGIGPTVGFPSTGRAARDVEDVLRLPHRDGRGLTAAEASLLEARLHALRDAAAQELRSFHSTAMAE